jgi:phage tail-like protein
MRQAAIERLLPAVYQQAATPGSPLVALLSVMEALHAPSEATLAHVDDLAAPYRAPDSLVPFLVRWVALDHVAPSRSGEPSIPLYRLRDLAARGAVLAQGRGTAGGLCALLATVTGVPGFTVEEPPDQPFHITVTVPSAAADQIDLVRRVVAAEKPAATTATVTT